MSDYEGPVACGLLFGVEIARHLGLDPAKVRSVTIRIEHGHAAMVTVEHLIHHPDETRAIEHVFKDYELTPRPDAKIVDWDLAADTP